MYCPVLQGDTMDLQTATQLPSHPAATELPLVVHVTDALDDEHGDSLLSLLHQMPAGRYRHMVIGWNKGAMWELRHSGHITQVVCIPPPRVQQDSTVRMVRLFRRLQRLQPALVHTHSTAVQWLAALAGVPVRLYGASADNAAPARHGIRSWLGRLLTPGTQPARQAAVDCAQFHPRLGPAAALGPAGFLRDDAIVIGAAGPMDGAGGHLQLAEAFIHLLSLQGLGIPLRLLITGDGPERMRCKALLQKAGVEHMAWLPGQRDDIARLMRTMDIFAAPACTPSSALHILQAMASGLPVVASQGGQHNHLVQTGWTGALVPQGDPILLADALHDYVRTPGMARRHGQRARRQALAHHSLSAVAQHYTVLYDRLLGR
jgi:glycosyltransferase involved in cell wall biosynthesis